MDSGVWAWLVQSVRLTDSALLELAGPDAVQYCRFQRYLMAYLSLTTVLAICVILPVNFQGSLYGSETDFGHTTMGNLEGRSHLLYIHSAVAFLLFPVSIFLMRRFSIALQFRDDVEISQVVQVEGVPRHLCTEKLIRRHLAEAYPSLLPTNVKVAYDVSELSAVAAELECAKDALQFTQQRQAEGEPELTMIDARCSRYCWPCCLCCRARVGVAEHYSEKVELLTAQLARLREAALAAPLGIAFISYNSLNSARTVCEDLGRGRGWWWCGGGVGPASSSLTHSLKPGSWRVSYAPPPSDIYWENLTYKKGWLYSKMILSNTLLLLASLFLTTPEYIAAQVQTILDLMFEEAAWQVPAWIQNFLPTLLLLSFTGLMPVLVASSVRWLGFWYRSEENHSVMRKTFWYLWFIVIIFPTFGLTTGVALLEKFLPSGNSSNHTGDDFRWDCIFLPDSGAFFVNYCITATFIGTSLELIRFPELFFYAVQVCMSSSSANSAAIQRSVTGEFLFGEQYARLLMMFAMVMMYSISCPLITPFGLLYFIFKHYVDKHNLAFVYSRSKISKAVHRSAINFVIFSVTVLQFFMTVFSVLRSIENDSGFSFDTTTTRSRISLLLLFLTIMVFAAQAWADWCKKISPIKFVDVLYADEEGGWEGEQQYIPSVLQSCYPLSQEDGKVDLCEVGTSNTSPGEQRYGTFSEETSRQSDTSSDVVDDIGGDGEKLIQID